MQKIQFSIFFKLSYLYSLCGSEVILGTVQELTLPAHAQGLKPSYDRIFLKKKSKMPNSSQIVQS